MKRRLKQWLKSDAAQGFACGLVAWYLRLVHRTGHWRVEGDRTAEEMWRAGKPFILCFWHGRLLMMPFAWNPPRGARGAPIHMLISDHRDGKLIARAVSHFGIDTIAGSDNRKPTAAMRALLRAVRAGQWIGITPDSPPGPRMRAKHGVAVLGRLTGVPVIPATYSASRRRVLDTWDRLVVPKPFARGVFLWGRPIVVPPDADDAAIDRARQQIEDALTALSAEADLMCGHQAIEPGPPLDAARASPIESAGADPAGADPAHTAELSA
jgi:lysophospholipid acyltransferase (LPLAT)-like uncharacterized protein